ncbi:hypothetical protein C8Q80DRAFT_1056624, partial [Daedaleopsis nitida]
MQLSFISVATVLFAAASVNAEKHIIRFENKCGKGTPQLIQGGKVLSTGQDFVSNGPFSAGIAYLQTGNCGFNGDNCSLLEMTLVNPTAPGAGSSTDISLITPHAFNVPTSFSYFGGCDRQGATCSSDNCPTAFFQPNDNQVQVQCQSDDVNLLITFCGEATESDAFSGGNSSHSSESVAATTKTTATNSSKPSTTVVSTKTTEAAHTEAVTATPTTTHAATTLSPAATTSATSRCRANSSRRRRRSVSAEPAILNAHRRHHARNA